MPVFLQFVIVPDRWNKTVDWMLCVVPGTVGGEAVVQFVSDTGSVVFGAVVLNEQYDTL